jgi:hypothetical protein
MIVNNELERGLKGSGRGLLSTHLVGDSKGHHEVSSQDCLYPGRDSNQAPAEVKSHDFPLKPSSSIIRGAMTQNTEQYEVRLPRRKE